MKQQAFLNVPWKRLSLLNCTNKFFIKFLTCNEDTSFSFCVTDLVRVWQYDPPSNEQIEQERLSYCPQLSMNTSNLVNYIRRCLLGELSQDAKLSLQEQEDDLLHICIDSSLKLSGIEDKYKLPFHWEFQIHVLKPDPENSSALGHSKRKHSDLSGATASATGPNKRQRLDQEIADNHQLREKQDEEPSVFVRDHVIYPLYSLVHNLQHQIEYLKRQCRIKDQALQRFRGMYSVQKSNLLPEEDMIFDPIRFEEQMIEKCHSYHTEVDISLSNLPNSFQSMYAKCVPIESEVMEVSMLPKEESSLSSQEQPLNVSCTSSNSSKSVEDSIQQVDDSAADGYIETEKEKKTRLELERKMQEQIEKRQKKQQQKKIIKALM